MLLNARMWYCPEAYGMMSLSGCACACASNHFRASCVYSVQCTQEHSIEEFHSNALHIHWKNDMKRCTNCLVHIMCANHLQIHSSWNSSRAPAYFRLNREHKNWISHSHVALVYITNTYSWPLSLGEFIAFHLFHILIIAYTFQQRRQQQR